MSALNFGLIGCGTIARTHASAIGSLGSAAHLSYVYDPVSDRASGLALETGARVTNLEALLDAPDVDAVSICSPSGTHAELAIMALNAGKHVLVEKPLDVSLAQCDLVLEAKKRTGLRLAVVSQTRYDSGAQELRDLVASGRLGKVHLVCARVAWFRLQEYYGAADWRGTWALDGGGCLANQGVHTIDLLLWTLGPIVEVHGRFLSATHSIESEDVLVATLVFASGALGSLVVTTSAYPGWPVSLSVHGHLGSTVVEGGKLKSLDIISAPSRVDVPTGGGQFVPGQSAREVAVGGTRSVARGVRARLASPSLWERDPADVWGLGHRAQLMDFINSVRKGREPFVGAQDGRDAWAVVTAIYDSCRTGRSVGV